MGEEPGLVLSNRVQPGPSPGSFPAQSFEFLHGPSNEMLVDTPCEGVQLGAVEDPVIADPASHLRVDLLGEAGQIRPTATIEVPCPDLLADSLGRLDTDGRGEAHEVASPAFGQAPPEGVAEEVEAGVLRFPRPVRVLAEHDLRLLGVQLEAECPEPGGDRVPQRAGLILRVAVRDNVIRLCRPADYADRGVNGLVGGVGTAGWSA